MRKFFAFPAVLSIMFLLPVAEALRQSPFPESGSVVRVADGDTVTVRFTDAVERRVRLIGVDAPELNDAREEVAWRAFLSRRFAFHHLYRRTVRLTYDASPLDDHGRVLAFVWKEDGTLFNESIIRQGFASAFLKYPFRADFQKRFRAAASSAREENKGFWRVEEPEEIRLSGIRDHYGEIVSLRFDCAEVLKKRSFLFLSAAGSDFEALIPLDRAALFPGAGSWAGRTLRIIGLAEEFAGRPQIVVAFPRQVRLT